MKNIAERGCREINTAGGITECCIHVSQDTSSAIFSVVFFAGFSRLSGADDWQQIMDSSS